MIHFEIPKNQSSIIKVIGVGGGGSNAVNYMYNLGIEGVDFVVCNTDSQALALSPVPNKVQLGPHLTQGLGAGANPEIGMRASEESLEDITKILKVNTRMAFITAGMGGGTGTGGAPVVAKICKDLGILTVGIVTLPFTYEGRKRMKQAEEGIERMREHVDTILIISNNKLRQQFGNLPFTKAFAMADDVLATAAKCITDVINSTGQINVDFADVCTVMKNGGSAILGNAAVAGENRALLAAEQALNSPLLNDNDIRGAKWILLNITSASGEFEHTMDEAEAIQAYVQQQAGETSDVILGMGHDPNLEDKLAVTIIATGFMHNELPKDFPTKSPEQEKIIVKLGDTNGTEDLLNTSGSAPATPASSTPTATIDPLAPVLVEMPLQMPKTASSSHTQNNSEPKELFHLNFTATETESQPVESQPKSNEPGGLQLSFREKPVTTINSEIKIGERVLTPEEIEEKARFEEQKRALEERAERLRRMSFRDQDTNDLENVPAYIRKNKKLDDNSSSADTFLSGYTIGFQDNRGQDQASIQTINTFLDGKKPD